jgi:hypothetical protein
MAKRYRRDEQKLQIEGQTIQWPKDTDEINGSYKSKVRQYSFCLSRRYLVAIVLSDLWFVASVYLLGTFWPLYCMTFDLKLLFISSVSSGHFIVWPLICSFYLSRRYLEAIVLSDLRFVASVLRYRRDKQKLQIEGQTIQWPQDTDEINRSFKSKVRQYNGHKKPTRWTEASNRRSDNKMSKRYRRDKQKLEIKGQTIKWPQDTDEINRSYKSKVRKDL